MIMLMAFPARKTPIRRKSYLDKLKPKFRKYLSKRRLSLNYHLLKLKINNTHFIMILLQGTIHVYFSWKPKV